jgi:mRNA interferase RelE/StbE
MAEVLVVEDAAEDFERYRLKGQGPRILKKLLLIEADPLHAGQSLGGPLTTYRKLVFGKNTWRIIFRPDLAGDRAVVWVIGDRDDSDCYATAKARIAKLGDNPRALRLLSVMLDHEKDRPSP